MVNNKDQILIIITYNIKKNIHKYPRISIKTFIITFKLQVQTKH